MKDTAQNRFRQTTAALVALALVLSAFGPVGTAAAAPTVTVAQSPNSTTVAPGDTVEIETELAVTELNAPQLVASLPSGWTIESQTADGPAAFGGDAWTWLAGDADGIDATYVVTYTVAVPDDAAPGEYTVGAEGSALAPDDGGRTVDTAQTAVTVQEEQPNAAPDADAGDDQTVTAGDSVTLDASGSSDADGDTLTYAWTQTGGPSVSLSDATAASLTFTAPDVEAETTMTFEVLVADGNGGADADSVSVTVEPDESDVPDESDETDPTTTVSLSPEEDLLGVNQTGSYDLVVDPAAGGVGAYSITVSLSDSTVGTITGVELAGDGSISDVQVAEDGSSVTIESVLVDTNDTGAVTLGTVSVQGVAEGETDLVLDVETLGTEAGTAYDVTAVDGATLTVSTLVVGGSDGPAIDSDGDGLHEDVNGDGVVDVLDVQTLFAARDGPTTTENPDAFDFNGDGQFDVLDVQWLYYNEVA